MPNTQTQLTHEERLSLVGIKKGEQQKEDARNGIYYSREVCEIMHGRIKYEMPHGPSTTIQMEDGTRLCWMYEDQYWGKMDD